ncbi:hypothetical protein ACW0US_18740 [Xanthomonas euvesicatoria]
MDDVMDPTKTPRMNIEKPVLDFRVASAESIIAVLDDLHAGQPSDCGRWSADGGEIRTCNACFAFTGPWMLAARDRPQLRELLPRLYDTDSLCSAKARQKSIMILDNISHIAAGVTVVMVLGLLLAKRQGLISGDACYVYSLLYMACMSAFVVFIRLFFT